MNEIDKVMDIRRAYLELYNLYQSENFVHGKAKDITKIQLGEKARDLISLSESMKSNHEWKIGHVFTYRQRKYELRHKPIGGDVYRCLMGVCPDLMKDSNMFSTFLMPFIFVDQGF